jgi:glycosyltransferase involved in cell wall biosynthesis
MLNGATRVESWQPGDGLRGYAALRNELRRWRPDVVFVPTARWIDVPAPVVVMTRNMEPLLAPIAGNGPVEALRNLARRAEARRACSRADRIVAVSGLVRAFLVERWQVGEDRIGVVPHGTGPVYAGPLERPQILDPVADRPFVFTAGSIRPARGLEDVISALPAVHADPPRLMLVVGGTPSPGMRRYHRRLERLAERLALSRSIIWAGNLEPAAMTWCYTRCAVFAMTSRVEACPNVALEALAAGAVCVSTDSPPMPEFFDNAATYYHGGDSAGLAAALRGALALCDEERARRSERASNRSRCFDWHVTARRTVDELVLAAAAGAGR